MAAPAARLPAVPGLTEANRRWWTLVGTCMGLFVLMLDSTVINIALTPIAHDMAPPRPGCSGWSTATSSCSPPPWSPPAGSATCSGGGGSS